MWTRLAHVVSAFDLIAAVIAPQLGLVVNVDSGYVPTVGAGGGSNSLALCFTALVAKTAAVAGAGKQRIAAEAGVRGAHQGISKPERVGLCSHDSVFVDAPADAGALAEIIPQHRRAAENSREFSRILRTFSLL